MNSSAWHFGYEEYYHSPMNPNAVELVRKFWTLMMSNDFRSVGSVLADDFVLDWPQSNERIRGRDNSAAMNEEYDS